jgi:hypothetical protein
MDSMPLLVENNDDCYERVKKAIGYSNSLIERLREQRENKILCDMILCVEDQLFYVHKYVFF